jgi:hypothetical protein
MNVVGGILGGVYTGVSGLLGGLGTLAASAVVDEMSNGGGPPANIDDLLDYGVTTSPVTAAALPAASIIRVAQRSTPRLRFHRRDIGQENLHPETHGDDMEPKIRDDGQGANAHTGNDAVPAVSVSVSQSQKPQNGTKPLSQALGNATISTGLGASNITASRAPPAAASPQASGARSGRGFADILSSFTAMSAAGEEAVVRNACNTGTGIGNKFSTVVKTEALDGWVRFCDGSMAVTRVTGSIRGMGRYDDALQSAAMDYSSQQY